MKKEKTETIDQRDIKKDIKIACEVLMVVFSMCLVTFLMFFATYKQNDTSKKEEAKKNAEVFLESDFFQIISYDI